MSLLMDALRKAELEKKKAAERLEQTVEQAQIQSDEDDEHNPPAAISDATGEHHITRMDRTHVRSREELLAATALLSLEPIDADIFARKPAGLDAGSNVAALDPSEDLTVNVLLDQVQPNAVEKTLVDEQVPHFEPSAEPTLLDEEMETGTDSPLDESFHDLDIGVSKEVPGIYDETIQGEPFRGTETERSYEETLPGVSALELFKDLGEENQPTPVAAQTIFTATATRSGMSSAQKWIAVVGLGLVVITAFSIVAYLAVTPLVNEIPEQQLAGELELVRPPVVLDTIPVAAPLPAEDTASIETDVIQSVIEPAGNIPTADDADAVVDNTTASQEPAGGDLITETQNEVLLTEANPATESDNAVLYPTPPELIKISRTRAPDERSGLLKEAYQSYQSRDYSAARLKYEGVLEVFPDNRDALLGLGAIAMKEGNLARVYEIYMQLFRLNPGDSLARAVLVNLDQQTNPVDRESLLKIMISDHPEDAFLYFSLGNVYAAQSRWAEAQQAYFDAYRNDTSNADFALNLAISLDRIGQSDTALDYYNTALKLADNQPSEFDSATILARIQTLTTRSDLQ